MILLKLKETDKNGVIRELDVSNLLSQAGMARVLTSTSPEYEQHVDRIERSLGKDFSFSEEERIAVFSRVYNGVPGGKLWPNLASGDLQSIVQFFSAGRGGNGNTGHYSRILEEAAEFTGQPLVSRGDAKGIVLLDKDNNEVFVGYRSLGKMPKHVDAAELVAFKIIENGDGTKSQVSIHLDVPPALKQSEQFVDPTTALHNAVFGGRPTEILKALALQPEIKSPEAALNQLGQFSPEIGKIQNINIEPPRLSRRLFGLSYADTAVLQVNWL